MTEIDPLVMALAYVPAFYLSLFAHEVGHALAGRAAGYVPTSLGLGVARPFCVVTVGGARVYLALVRPFNGLALAFHPQIAPSRTRLVAFLAGGVLCNAALAAASAVLLRWVAWGAGVWAAFLLANAALAAGNLIPMRIKSGKLILRSDGAQIVQALRAGSCPHPSAMVVQGVEAVQALCAWIGDRTYARLNLLAGAEAWLDLGDPGRAGAMLGRARAMPDGGLPVLRWLDGYVTAELALAEGRADDAGAALDAAEAALGSAGGEVHALLASVLRAGVRLGRGDAEGAVRDLDALRSNPLLRRRPLLRRTLSALRLDAALAASDASGLQAAVAEHETLSRVLPSASRDLRTYRAVARFHAGRGDAEPAAASYRRVLSALGEVAGMWLNPAEWKRFVARHWDLAEEARECLLSLGAAEEAKRLTAPLLRQVSLADRQAEAARLRDRRLRRIGFRIMLFNLVALAGLALLTLSLGARTRLPFLVLALSLTLFTLTGALYLAIDLTLGRLVPLLRRAGGAVILILSCCPWAMLVVSLVLYLLGA